MRLSIVRRLLALAAVATAPLLATAQAPAGVENNENVFSKPAVNGDIIVANQPYDIQWTPSANPGTVSIILVKGVEPNLQVVETVAPAVANSGKFTWTPPLTLEGLQTMPADQVYKFKIVNDISGNFGFSLTFKVDSPGSTFVATSAVSSASSAPASSSSDPAGAAAATTDSTTISVTSSIPPSSSAPPTTSSSAASSSSISSISSSSSAAPSTSSPTPTQTTLSTITSTPPASKFSASPTSSSAAAAAETDSDSESPTASATAEPAAAAGGKMGTGAVAGITAGTVGAIIIAIAIVFLVRRSKQASRQRLVGSTPAAAPSKYDRDFQMMERRARHRPTSSFGFNTTRSDASGGIVGDRHDPYVQLNDRDSFKRDSGTWMASRF
ncbi:hypothetical protein TWF696_001392 [Orbilia brochopaga]|uniref:Yeast cell wall synthesis Kre9/Knh1-like N-terminal domain-containing protein n=1 Tax=Orbilia brochopaga TaxID=3140254 RepID=A0AAV9UCZ4_9PEZI